MKIVDAPAGPALQIVAGGLPVRLSWLLLPVLPIAWLMTGSFVASLLSQVSWVLLVLVHEFGHATVARRFGLRVVSIDVSILHGLCTHEAPRSDLQRIAIAWGGVSAQMALVVLCTLLSYAVTIPPALAPAMTIFGPYSLLMIVFNLLPVPPLDGATAWRIVPYALGAMNRRMAGKPRLAAVPRRATQRPSPPPPPDDGSIDGTEELGRLLKFERKR